MRHSRPAARQRRGIVAASPRSWRLKTRDAGISSRAAEEVVRTRQCDGLRCRQSQGLAHGPVRRVARRQVNGSCETSVACRDAMAWCCGRLREPGRRFGARSSFGWNELRCTSLFFKGLFIVRHIVDYAMAATGPVAITIPASAPSASGSNRRSSMKCRRVSLRALTSGVVGLDSGLWL